MNAVSVDRQAGVREGLVLVLSSSLTIMGSVMIAPMIPKMIAQFEPRDSSSAVWVPLAVTGPALAIGV